MSSSTSHLNLCLDEYNMDELFQLFQLNPRTALTDAGLKQARQYTMRIHPDKSGLDPKFYIFFKSAYERLQYMHSIQNKNKRTPSTVEEMRQQSDIDMSTEQKHLLRQAVDQVGSGADFNKWFNNQYTKSAPDEMSNRGYGDWLKSNDDLPTDIPTTGTRTDIDRYFTARKKQMHQQQVVLYKGVEETSQSDGIQSSMLDPSQVTNYSSGSKLCGGHNGVMYTDLKQAYTETIIPVSEELSNVDTSRTFDTIQRSRTTQSLAPLSNVETNKILQSRRDREDQMNASLAFRYAQEAERANKANNTFWGGIQRIMN